MESWSAYVLPVELASYWFWLDRGWFVGACARAAFIVSPYRTAALDHPILVTFILRSGRVLQDFCTFFFARVT